MFRIEPATHDCCRDVAKLWKLPDASTHHGCKDPAGNSGTPPVRGKSIGRTTILGQDPSRYRHQLAGKAVLVLRSGKGHGKGTTGAHAEQRDPFDQNGRRIGQGRRHVIICYMGKGESK